MLRCLSSLCNQASILRSLSLAIAVATPWTFWDTYCAGQDAAAPTADAAITLSVGDPAPALLVDHWLKGAPVSEYGNDKFYIIEFWATWCAPCIKSMPHLDKLAKEYSHEGLVVVALTTADDVNTIEATKSFIAEQGSQFDFRYAFCSDSTTYKNYMTAAGRNSIPSSFVVDREGKIAFIGMPQDLDYVLARLVKGSWRGKADADELEELNKSLATVGELAQSDPEKAAAILDHIERVNPARTQAVDYCYPKIMLLCKQKKQDEAKKLLESRIPVFQESGDLGSLAMLCGLLASANANPEGTHRDFALAKLEETKADCKEDWQMLLQVGVGFQLAGEQQKFIECFEKSIEYCPDETTKQILKSSLQRMEQSLQQK